jgi:hypothetical protein
MLKCKERNCAFKNLSLRCGTTQKSLRTFALKRNIPNSAFLHMPSIFTRHLVSRFAVTFFVLSLGAK